MSKKDVWIPKSHQFNYFYYSITSAKNYQLQVHNKKLRLFTITQQTQVFNIFVADYLFQTSKL